MIMCCCFFVPIEESNNRRGEAKSTPEMRLDNVKVKIRTISYKMIRTSHARRRVAIGLFFPDLCG